MVQASEGIELSGSIAKPADDLLMRAFFLDELERRIPSGLFTAAEGGGIAGNLSIVTPELIVRDGAEVTVGSRDGGTAGSLEIEASEIRLDTRGKLRADNSAGLGNINLMTQDLQLRRQSQISTNATGMERGGNITIETETLVALENSDITANATNSNGGQVTVTANGIFGTALREQLTPDSDITASSKQGAAFSGMVRVVAVVALWPRRMTLAFRGNARRILNYSTGWPETSLRMTGN